MASRWRALLLALCALGIALIAIDVFVGYASKKAASGLNVVSTGKPYLQKVVAPPRGSAAARSGLRAGDVLDTRPMSMSDRYRLYNEAYTGKSIRVYVVRRSGFAVRTIGNVPLRDLTWDVWVGYAGNAWMLLFAGILAVRRPESRDARILALLLIGFNFEQALVPGDWITPWAGLDAAASVLASLAGVCLALLATYALSFARPPSLLRRALLGISYGVAWSTAAFGTLQVIAQCTGILDPSNVIFTSPWTALGPSALFAFPFFCGIVTAVETRGGERTRFLWAFVPLALFYIIGSVGGASVSYPQIGRALLAVFNVALFLAPLGLTYSLLSRRLLDIGFALNRAAIFSGVSLVLVGAFVLVEWLLSDWLQLEGHSANIAVSGALALVLGLSMRFVHGKVEHFVDHVMFRKRREDEEAIQRMAREAPYITTRATLLERTEDTLMRHADASLVNIVLDEGNGRYGSVSENDPALISLRADHARVDLHALDTAVEGEWAYPMVARGRLVGALVLGPKRSQESYAPDESEAIAQLAHSVAGALDVLSTQAPADALNIISRSLQSLNAAIAQMPEAIARELRATPAE